MKSQDKLSVLVTVTKLEAIKTPLTNGKLNNSSARLVILSMTPADSTHD